MELTAAFDYEGARQFVVMDEFGVRKLEMDLTGVPGVTTAMLDRALLSNGFERLDGEDWVDLSDAGVLVTYPVGR